MDSSSSENQLIKKKGRRTYRRKLVGLYLGEHDSRFRQGVLQVALESGWDLLDIGLMGTLRPLAHHQLDGVIMDLLPTDPIVKSLIKKGIPTVRYGIAPHPKDSVEHPAVMFDFSLCGRLVADHFAERNFKHLGYVGLTPWGNNGEVMYESFKDRAEERGMSTKLFRFSNMGGLSPDEVFELRVKEWREMLENQPKPLGLFIGADLLARKCMVYSMMNGFEVPEDIALVGSGNDEVLCETTSAVALSSIELGHSNLGQSAARLLTRLMEGQKLSEPREFISPLHVVQRRSSDILAVEEPAVTKAIRYIWDHFDEPLTVDQIAREVHVSRRKLERGFEKYLRRGINEEIQRKRLEEAAFLLRDSDLSISKISEITAIGDPSHLHKLFKKHHSMTPSRYRKSHQG